MAAFDRNQWQHIIGIGGRVCAGLSRSRAAVEPVIGHVKYDCRMIRNYLKGTIGNDINANLAAAGFNFRGLLNKIKEEILWVVFSILIFYPRKKLNQIYT